MTGKKATRREEQAQENKAFESAYWETVWSEVHLPTIRDPRSFHELHSLFKAHLKYGPLDFLEVGCAPGSWMAYFAKQFGYRVSGVDSAAKACEKTVENLRLLAVQGRIELADFLEYDGGPFDVIFSYGFVEHFDDPGPVFDRLVGLCKPGGVVVTAIPSLSGLNWWISRTFRPRVAAGHFPMTGQALRAHHESRGLKTLCMKKYGVLQIVSPWSKTVIERRYPRLAGFLGLPFRVWNGAVSAVTRALEWYPAGGPIYSGTVYIGERVEPSPMGEPRRKVGHGPTGSRGHRGYCNSEFGGTQLADLQDITPRGGRGTSFDDPE